MWGSISFFRFFFSFTPSLPPLPLPSPWAPPAPLKHRFFPGNNLNFKAGFWVREEEDMMKERRNAPTETGPLPQSHAQDIFVIRVRGNPSLRLLNFRCCLGASEPSGGRCSAGRSPGGVWRTKKGIALGHGACETSSHSQNSNHHHAPQDEGKLSRTNVRTGGHPPLSSCTAT